MADALTIAGTAVPVVAGSWTEPPSLFEGARVVMKGNNVFSTEDPATERKRFACSLRYYTRVAVNTFLGTVPKGSGVVINGELPGGPFTVLVDVGQIQVERRLDHANAQVLVYTVPLEMEEKSP